jgi:hypothetical protein
MIQQTIEITAKELAKRIREGKRVCEVHENIAYTIPTRIKVIDGNVTLSEGANIGF